MSDPRLIGMTKPKLIEEVERLREENEQLREIEIIQEGAHISVTIGGVDALPLCIHRNFGDDMERLREENADLQSRLNEWVNLGNKYLFGNAVDNMVKANKDAVFTDEILTEENMK